MPHKPDFFIIGAPKCGTTTLYRWLKDHPDIFMPDAKEPHYFAQNLSDRYCRVRDEGQYLSLFEDKKDNQISGEASVLYGFSAESIKAILKFNPLAKIIFMVRHPIDMIISYHGQLLVNLEEDLKSFERAWNAQDDRVKGDKIPSISTDTMLLQYGDIGQLSKHLQAVLDIVPKDQLKVILLDDMAHDPKCVYEEALVFLDRQSDARTIFERENEASAIKYQWLEKIKRSHNPFLKFIKNILGNMSFLKDINNFNQAQRIDIEFNIDFLNNLHDHFKNDIQYLESYFGKKIKTKYERSA